MSRAAAVQALSLGYALDASGATSGVVQSVFRQAVNVLIDGEMWTLLAEGKSDLPFGLRVALTDFDALGLRRGEPVQVRSGFVGVGSRLVVDGRAAARWTPSFEKKIAPGFPERLAVVAEAVCGRAWGGSAEVARAVQSAIHSPAALGSVLAQVVGRGPGATPSGDDVLVGILAVLTFPHSHDAGARDADALRRALLPLLPTTTDLSGHLLSQATRGLFGRDLHELVSALIANQSPDRNAPTPGSARALACSARRPRRVAGPLRSAQFAPGAPAPELSGEGAENHTRGRVRYPEFSASPQLATAIRRVVETGATSGADVCAGLLAFAPAYFIRQPARPAA